MADIYYGWREYGDNTDTVDWPMWFTDEVMGLVYQELGQMTAPNTLDPAPGENTIVMFKSCFPNSDVGSDISDEKAIYNSLLPYLQAHPDKMFVLVTPPPMISISDPQKTRELCDWLTDRDNGWLAGLSTGNVFVFDLYNVLTDPDAHHRLVDGVEVHEVVPAPTPLLRLDGDDHPNVDGNVKATEEFVPLLNSGTRSSRLRGARAGGAAAAGDRAPRALLSAVCSAPVLTSSPTHSTCGVCGNMSTGVTRSSR